jgi:hypothetical protein
MPCHLHLIEYRRNYYKFCVVKNAEDSSHDLFLSIVLAFVEETEQNNESPP